MTFIAHRTELAQDGDYVRLPHLTAYNNAGDIIVWNGRCPHRGAMIFDIGMGNKKMKCPYHGWESDLIEGKVDRIPTRWVGEFLFVEAGDDDLDSVTELPTLSTKLCARHSFDFLNMQCDWRVAVENALEDMHVPHVHPTTFGTLKMSSPMFIKLGRNSTAVYSVDARVARTFGSAVYFHLLLYPNTCISSVAGASYSIQQYFSNGPDTVFLTRLYQPSSNGGRESVSSDPSFFLKQAREWNIKVFTEDAHICARVEGTGTILTANEKRIKWFREEIENNWRGR